MSKVQKNTVQPAKVAKRTSRTSPSPNYVRYIVNSSTRAADRKCSAILEVETRRERSRTLKEYEKQRGQIWAFLEDD